MVTLTKTFNRHMILKFYLVLVTCNKEWGLIRLLGL